MHVASWTVICRGAVIRGMMLIADIPHAVTVQSRVSCYNLGILVGRPFMPPVLTLNLTRSGIN